jgi:hypothetical protein
MIMAWRCGEAFVSQVSPMGVWYTLACDSRQSWAYMWCEGPSRNTRFLLAVCQRFTLRIVQTHTHVEYVRIADFEV